MRDFMNEMLDTRSKQGDQAAYDMGTNLLVKIENEHDWLNKQASAIRAFGKYLRDTSRVVEPEPESHPPLQRIDPADRPRSIIRTAYEVWETQQREYGALDREATLIKVQDVFERLTDNGLDLGVQQPLAVIGTVLASADEFTRVERNTFEYIPEPPFEFL